MYIMECGHIENAKTIDDKPFCAICNCEIIKKQVTDNIKDVRYAKCHCGKTEPSSPDLPFFGERPECKFDTFYCGCDGWN